MKRNVCVSVALFASSVVGLAQAPAGFGSASFLAGRVGGAVPPAGTVSVARLLHKTPAMAWAAFHRGAELFDAGALSRSTAEFERAVSLDPGFPEAHCNLGVNYMELYRPEDAAAEFGRAIQLDPSVSAYHTNLAAALTTLGRPEEGEAEARTAIGLDSASAKAHLMLGLLLARRPETRPAAESHLAYAGRKLPVALTTLEKLHRMEVGPPSTEP